MIRLVRYDELPLLLPLGKIFFETIDEPGEWNPEFCLRQVQMLYETRTGCMFADFTDEYPTGILGIRCYQDMFTGEWNASEFIWASQGSGGIRLLKYACEFVKSLGVKHFYMHHTAHLTPDKIHKLFKKHDFNLKFYRYRKEL